MPEIVRVQRRKADESAVGRPRLTDNSASYHLSSAEAHAAGATHGE
jgi:hypothetical protein